MSVTFVNHVRAIYYKQTNKIIVCKCDILQTNK